ncbi:hypothetical protein D3C74_374880 [compost metagenome]
MQAKNKHGWHELRCKMKDASQGEEKPPCDKQDADQARVQGEIEHAVVDLASDIWRGLNGAEHVAPCVPPVAKPCGLGPQLKGIPPHLQAGYPRADTCR